LVALSLVSISICYPSDAIHRAATATSWIPRPVQPRPYQQPPAPKVASPVTPVHECPIFSCILYPYTVTSCNTSPFMSANMCRLMVTEFYSTMARCRRIQPCGFSMWFGILKNKLQLKGVRCEGAYRHGSNCKRLAVGVTEHCQWQPQLLLICDVNPGLVCMLISI
jgi:hypothetical protein